MEKEKLYARPALTRSHLVRLCFEPALCRDFVTRGKTTSLYLPFSSIKIAPPALTFFVHQNIQRNASRITSPREEAAVISFNSSRSLRFSPLNSSSVL